MPETFSINGQPVTSADFEAAVQVFQEATGQDLTPDAADGHLTHEEIFSVLDQNRDGHLRYPDFSSGSAPLVTETQLFNNLESLLSRHGFGLFDEIEDPISLYYSHEIPPVFWNNRNFVLRAVQNFGPFLCHAAPELQDDEEIVRTATLDYGTALECASVDQRCDPEMGLAAVQQTGWALRRIPRECRTPALIRAAAERSGRSLRYGDALSQDNPEIVMPAVLQEGTSLEFAGPTCQANPQIVAAAVHENAEASQYMAPSLWNDLVFLGNLVVANHQMMNFIDPASQDEVWQNALSHLRSEGFVFDEAETTTYENFLLQVMSHNIRFPNRLRSLRTAFTIMRNLDSPLEAEDARPLAVFFYPQAEPHPAAEDRDEFDNFPLVDLFVESGLFRVLYYEVTIPVRETTEIAERLIGLSPTGGPVADTLVLGAAGSATTMGFGDLSPLLEWEYPTQETYYIDTGDFEAGEMGYLPDLILPGGQLFLYAGWAGGGGTERDNLANRFSNLLPGIQIYSNGSGNTIFSFGIRENMGIDIEWRDHQPHNPRSE